MKPLIFRIFCVVCIALFYFQPTQAQNLNHNFGLVVKTCEENSWNKFVKHAHQVHLFDQAKTEIVYKVVDNRIVSEDNRFEFSVEKNQFQVIFDSKTYKNSDFCELYFQLENDRPKTSSRIQFFIRSAVAASEVKGASGIYYLVGALSGALALGFCPTLLIPGVDLFTGFACAFSVNSTGYASGIIQVQNSMANILNSKTEVQCHKNSMQIKSSAGRISMNKSLGGYEIEVYGSDGKKLLQPPLKIDKLNKLVNAEKQVVTRLANDDAKKVLNDMAEKCTDERMAKAMQELMEKERVRINQRLAETTKGVVANPVGTALKKVVK